RYPPSPNPHRLTPFLLSNDRAPPERYTLSLHDALPIYAQIEFEDDPINYDTAPTTNPVSQLQEALDSGEALLTHGIGRRRGVVRSEEHTSELQSRENLVCRLLLEKKNKHAKTLCE